MTIPVPIAAKLDGVREVTLIGTSDLGFWTERLATEALIPMDRNGFTEIHVIAASARFMGRPFREVSISVAIETADPLPRLQGARLLHAFNSSRLFACIERTMFSAPYRYGNVSVSQSPIAQVRVDAGRKNIVLADQKSLPDTPSSMVNETWSGPVFLPDRAGVISPSSKLFFAELSGESHCYEFDRNQDRWAISTEDFNRWIPEFAKAGFTPTEWRIRPSARHTKSKTIKRSRLGTLDLK